MVGAIILGERNFKDYTGKRFAYEWDCCWLSWSLAQLNPTLLEQKGLLQRATDNVANFVFEGCLSCTKLKAHGNEKYKPHASSALPLHPWHRHMLPRPEWLPGLNQDKREKERLKKLYLRTVEEYDKQTPKGVYRDPKMLEEASRAAVAFYYKNVTSATLTLPNNRGNVIESDMKREVSSAENYISTPTDPRALAGANQSTINDGINRSETFSGGSSSATASSFSTTQNNTSGTGFNFANPNYFPSGKDGNNPDQPPQRSELLDETVQRRAGGFAGIAILSDSQGWRQKLYMSYRLAVCPDCEEGDEMTSTVFTKFAVDNIEISVARAIFKDESRQPQFRIRRTTISIEPSVEGSPQMITDDYRDLWYTIDRHPSRQYYQMMPGLNGSEVSIIGQLNIAASPSATVGFARKSSSARNTHPITAVVNLDKSEFQATAFGGLA